jgi:UDP-glucose 4-epimerase
MKIVLAGGAGDVGKHVCLYLLRQGHQVTIVDKKEAAFTASVGSEPVILKADLSDLPLLTDIIAGNDIVVNLAWSFSDDPHELFDSDILGHINVLQAAAAARAKRLIYASTAGVYGVPGASAIEETHCCHPEQARKPLYSVAKHCAEQLSAVLGCTYGIPTTILRFWWAFGASIAGKHLRELIKLAITSQPISMVAEAGGTFATMDDIGLAVELAATRPHATGTVYNVGSLYLSWLEIIQLIIDITGSKSPLQLTPSAEWTGPAFLNETWQLNCSKAGKELGYRPLLDNTDTKQLFRQALVTCVQQVTKTMSSGK